MELSLLIYYILYVSINPTLAMFNIVQNFIALWWAVLFQPVPMGTINN